MPNHIRSEMQFSSEATAAKILPQSQREKAFQVRMGEPMTLAMRSVKMNVLNKGDNNLTFQPQHATSEDGPWTNIGGATTVKARTEKLIQFAIPAGAEFWRIQGTGDTVGCIEIYEADGAHANIGLP